MSRCVAAACVITLSLLAWRGWPTPVANPCGASPPAKTLSGTVKAVSADSLRMERGSKEWTFALSEAVVEMAQKLKAGESVTVRYIEANGKLIAVKVTGETARATK